MILTEKKNKFKFKCFRLLQNAEKCDTINNFKKKTI